MTTSILIALVVLVCLMVFQFMTAIDKGCYKLAILFGTEILLFAGIMRTF